MASIQASILDRFLHFLNLTGYAPDADPVAVRERLNALAVRTAGAVENVSVTPTLLGGVSTDWLKPTGVETKRTLLYLHGGGYIICNPETHRATVARLANAAEADAFVPDYRLAPEDPFPAPVEDAVATYLALIQERKLSPREIVVAGDSAGGGLAVALMLALKQMRKPLPAAAILMSPWTDLAFTGMSHLNNRSVDPMIALEGAMLAARHYLGDTIPTHPLASPLYGDLKGLPPLMIHVGSKEILLDDATRLAQRAGEAGVDVRLKVWNDMPHVFQGFSFVPEARESIEELGAFAKTRAPLPAPRPLSWAAWARERLTYLTDLALDLPRRLRALWQGKPPLPKLPWQTNSRA